MSEKLFNTIFEKHPLWTKALQLYQFGVDDLAIEIRLSFLKIDEKAQALAQNCSSASKEALVLRTKKFT